ncbi:uncharacterized protein LOC133796314 [Humulus lupulus]|uniref:uncharacterized protein LOC133796314 n=1 Tax=Humulus lupulus TaxID=3486 RepID=UPI002B4158B7|nr:uncharacterized protein LOC133796314 [Humulus lupulus]
MEKQNMNMNKDVEDASTFNSHEDTNFTQDKNFVKEKEVIDLTNEFTAEQKPRITLGCERRRNYKIQSRKKDDNNSRRTSIRKYGCPFRFKGKKLTANKIATSEKRRLREKVHASSSCLDAFPKGLQPYIKLVKNVIGDGNCGFRAIADLIGIIDEDGWTKVRKDLLNEIESHLEHYRELYGVHGRIDELIHALSFFDVRAPRERWMTMPDMGHIIASCYNVVLFHLSKNQSLTFLPLRSMPLPLLSRKHIAIGFVNGDHYVKVYLSQDHPVPPIAGNWCRHHLPIANGWESEYLSKIQQFNEIVGSTSATREIIEIDCE